MKTRRESLTREKLQKEEGLHPCQGAWMFIHFLGKCSTCPAKLENRTSGQPGFGDTKAGGKRCTVVSDGAVREIIRYHSIAVMEHNDQGTCEREHLTGNLTIMVGNVGADRRGTGAIAESLPLICKL